MKALILSSLLMVSTFSTHVFAEDSEKASSPPEQSSNKSLALDDLMTPQEISQELGFSLRDPMWAGVVDPEVIAAKDGIDVYREYPIVLKINKAAKGRGAQQMQVIENGKLIATWPVSTGREQHEKAKSGRWYQTTTPTGTFSPYRLVRDHYSNTWKAQMEFAVFFIGGIAVHATTPDHYSELGQRASGGCVRIHRDNAKLLWSKINSYPEKLVPLFNKKGRVSRDKNGNPIRAIGWGTLIIVENK
ncbi:L,D-transpeptidase [Bdellovibrio sp. SKB1291214]|uniref:L,D-transpeptidase n=1 Tax=Bdellovibrio sp. SKB1291214 TaxID=1732569 RepID=UPI000B51AE54|nr:L,D-transpeptidase [Bdellovibrio sp. SKB1291214]UYL08887.1 L,D-transpeptidase [Bdellovibrio sp. SKB1291214]